MKQNFSSGKLLMQMSRRSTLTQLGYISIAISTAIAPGAAFAKSIFQAEDIIEAKEPTLVCQSLEDLIDAWQAASRGERTRIEAYLDKKICVFAAPGDRLRVLSARVAPALEVVPLSTSSAAKGLFTAGNAFKKIKK